MYALRKLQQSFAADIWDDGLHRLDGIVLDGHLPAERLFQVYRNNFWIATEDALADIYGVVKQLVGNQFFAFVVDHFLRRFPPRHGNMHLLGNDLAVFLCDFDPVADLPYLPDVARLEWAYHQVFHAQDAQPFNLETLATIPLEDLLQWRFELAASSRLVNSPFPIFEIWRVNQPGYSGDQSVDLDTGDETVLLTRPGYEVELRRLEPDDARFLQRLTGGDSLERATEAAVELAPAFDLELALAKYLAPGALVPADQDSSGPASDRPVFGGK